ncbi:YtxH domain-containing protein [Mesobacillus maritimus]|uniref:YtxH domain-containing protein n=1 Tax=Mesobacillus maritimus TaxID=1643336 RepID=UPI00384C34DE
MNGKSLFLGFLAGGAIAGIATLLSAPAPGRETRNKIATNKNIAIAELQDIKERLLEIKDSASAASIEAKTVFADFIRDIKLALNEWETETAPIKQELAKELKELEQTLEELEKSFSTHPNHS